MVLGLVPVAYAVEEPSGISVSVSDITETGATLEIMNTSEESNTYPIAYYMVKPAGEVAPNAEELKDSGTQTQDSDFTTGSSNSTSVFLTDLTAGTNYVAYAVVYHAANQSYSDVGSATFTTTGGAVEEPSGVSVSV